MVEKFLAILSDFKTMSHEQDGFGGIWETVRRRKRPNPSSPNKGSPKYRENKVARTPDVDSKSHTPSSEINKRKLQAVR